MVRLAEENRDWGYRRIQVALSNLGHEIARSTIQYEFGPDRAAQIRAADKLMQVSMTAVALVWNHVSFSNERGDQDSQSHPALAGLRQAVEDGLSSISDAVQKRHSGRC